MITFSDFKINLKKRWKSVLFLANLTVFLGLGLSLIQPFLYKTSFSLLIIQDTKESSNIYSSIESSDKLANLLKIMVKTSDFQNSIINSDFNINKDDFSDDEATKRKEWNKMIKIGIIPGSGIVNFDVYYKNRLGAEEYAKAIVSSIVNDGAQMYGGSKSIKFKVVNSPLTSNKPATPNILLNGILSLFIGLLSSLFYVYFTTTESQKKDIFYDEELEKEKEEVFLDLNTSSINNVDITVLPNSKINNLNKQEDFKIESNIEKKDEVVDVNNYSIKVDNKLEQEDVIPNVGFLKNVNDRVKSVINKEN